MSRTVADVQRCESLAEVAGLLIGFSSFNCAYLVDVEGGCNPTIVSCLPATH